MFGIVVSVRRRNFDDISLQIGDQRGTEVKAAGDHTPLQKIAENRSRIACFQDDRADFLLELEVGKTRFEFFLILFTLSDIEHDAAQAAGRAVVVENHADDVTQPDNPAIRRHGTVFKFMIASRLGKFMTGSDCPFTVFGM